MLNPCGQLAAWLAQRETLRRRLVEHMPPLPDKNLRDCQVSAVTGLEQSLAQNKSCALAHMATGAGKTFTTITSVYRLLKFGAAKRFQAWTFRHNALAPTAFTPEQMDWLRLMKDHIASSCAIARDDFDYAALADNGGLQKAWGLFGGELDGLMDEMNRELVA